MHRLIPTIYFYTVSLIGLVLLVIGVFASIHYIINTTQFSSYPLGYGVELRCQIQQPIPENGNDKTVSVIKTDQNCLQEIERERQQVKIQDLEKAISFTLIGVIIFGIHFYFARKQSAKSA